MTGFTRQKLLRTAAHMAVVIIVLAVACLPQDAFAQTGKNRRQMIRLAEIMGGLHHVRGSCYRPEREEWKLNFYRMINLEKPNERFRARLVRAFQEGYAEHRARYPNCDINAAARASDLAEDGERLSQSLMYDYR